MYPQIAYLDTDSVLLLTDLEDGNLRGAMRPGMEDKYDDVMAFLFGERGDEHGKFKIEGVLRRSDTART